MGEVVSGSGRSTVSLSVCLCLSVCLSVSVLIPPVYLIGWSDHLENERSGMLRGA